MLQQHKRAIFKIRNAISELKLDLTNLTVLTEVGSNNYLYLPIIAGMANAKKVYVWTRDTSFSNAQNVKSECLQLAASLGLEQIEIEIDNRNTSHISEANIITNSGFLRPLDSTFLDNIKPSHCVIPLMYEAWEIRHEDVDIEYCQKKGIKVAGTWENHPSIKVFNSVGALAIKLAMEGGFEVCNNNILVWSSDEFGETITKAFKKLDANEVVLTRDINVLEEMFDRLDFIFIADYHESRAYFTDNTNSVFPLEKFINARNDLGVIHLYGDVDVDLLSKSQIKVFPKTGGQARKMSRTLGYVGQSPIISLQAAGLKVAEDLIRNKKNDLIQPMTFNYE